LKGHAFRRADTVCSNEPASAGDTQKREPEELKPETCLRYCGTPEGTLPHSRFALRIGLRYARGLREETARAILRERNRSPFSSIADLAYRVPELRRDEMVLLASIGALNSIGGDSAIAKLSSRGKNSRLHRRDALWQVERAARFAGRLLDGIPESDTASPLAQMSAEERLVADFHGTGLTVGPHPLAYRRADLQRARVLSAKDLTHIPNGKRVCTAGCVIARQRPGTAKGFIFLSMEDETGIANVIVTPDLYERERVVVTRSKFILAEGLLQNQDGVIHVKAARLMALPAQALDMRSRDFH
jgi:error-prone DNA polymerase